LKTRLTQVLRQTDAVKPTPRFRTGLSLHSHTHHSKESLDFLPRYLEYHNTPVVTRLVQGRFARYKQETGKVIDFTKAYWTPPLTPALVLESEAKQIHEKLGLAPIVSITDHDTIDAPLELQNQTTTAVVPVSVEWSVPFEGNCFHLGVHHLPLSRAPQTISELAEFTRHPSDERLCALLAYLDSQPETLLVLNHPCCNFVKVPAEQHWGSLRSFLRLCRPWLHAIEINGMRPWKENLKVAPLAESYDMPIVAGGDRHGRRPNTMLNLSEADTWGEYVSDIRSRRANTVLVLPAYEEPVRLRELATAGDVLRRYPHHPYGRRRFTDRIYADVEGYSWHRLSFYLDGGKGTPVWLPPIAKVVIALGSDPARAVLRRVFSMAGEYDEKRGRAKTEFASLATTLMMESNES